MKTIHLLIPALLLMISLAGCGGGGSGSSAGAGTGVKLTGLSLDTANATDLHYMGDLWPSTWASDDRLYMAFGDGTGMKNCAPNYPGNVAANEPGVVVSWAANGSATQASCPAGQWKPGLTVPAGAGFYNDFCDHNDCSQCYNICRFTPNGLVALSGSPPSFQDCTGTDQCVIYRDLPVDAVEAGTTWVKTSSIIAIGSRLVVAAHFPAGTVTDGYLAFSDDFGVSWTKASGTSPWTDTNNSHFKVLVFIQMGKAYGENTDGYLYALGMDHELNQSNLTRMDVYLARVPKDKATDYTAYEYYSAAGPVWSSKQSDAVPVPGLSTYAQSSAMYHSKLKKYLFFSGLTDVSASGEGAVFAADNPWGPWSQVGTFPGNFIGSVVPKGIGNDSVYFTAAGSTFPYTLNLIKLTFQTK